MNPVVLHGCAAWDQRYLPRDEFAERLRIVQAAMTRRGMAGLVVFGHYADYGDLCYLTQYIPQMISPSIAVVTAEGGITLASVGPEGAIPAAKARTWVEDVRTIRTFGGGLRALLAERGIAGEVGLVGAETSLSAKLYDEVREALCDLRCQRADDLMATVRRGLRPREMSALREAARIVCTAAHALSQAHASGMSNAAAMVEADGEARRLGALDFRGLTNQDPDGELMPVESLAPFRSEPLIAYLAASFQGYWADLAVTIGEADGALLAKADRVLRSITTSARPGVKAGDLAQRLVDELGPVVAERAGRYGLGHGIGLALALPPTIAPGGEQVLGEDCGVTLRLRLDNAGQSVLVSDLLLVRSTGAESVFSAAVRER